MEDKPISGEESLQIINQMIGEAKRSYITTGLASIVWGALIFICGMVTWAQIHYNFSIGFDIWLLLFVALVVQIIFSVKQTKIKNFKTRLEGTINAVWTTFGICIMLITVYQNVIPNVPHSIFLYLVLYGMPTFITGMAVKFYPMIIGGIICWVMAIISLFTGTEVNFLLMAISGVIAWLIPGIILWRRYSQQRKVNV